MSGIVSQLLRIWKEQKGLCLLAVLIFCALFGYTFLKKPSPSGALHVQQKVEESKGFELFDASTWIKGDKELEVLAMRALKGQLEREIARFDSIAQASLILDLEAPQASLILTLAPGARLSASELLAINSHLRGAVAHLQTEHIAISDTTGVVYQSLEGEGCFLPRIERMLRAFASPEHFYVEECVVMLDQKVFTGVLEEAVRQQLASWKVGVHVFPFGGAEEERPSKELPLSLFVASAFVATVGVIAALFFVFKGKNKPPEQPKPRGKQIAPALAHSIQGQDPRLIATMLSYLEPEKAEKIATALPEEVRQQVLVHLAELENEGDPL